MSKWIKFKQWLTETRKYLGLKITRGAPKIGKALSMTIIGILSVVIWLPIVWWKMGRIIANLIVKYLKEE